MVIEMDSTCAFQLITKRNVALRSSLSLTEVIKDLMGRNWEVRTQCMFWKPTNVRIN